MHKQLGDNLLGPPLKMLMCALKRVRCPLAKHGGGLCFAQRLLCGTYSQACSHWVAEDTLTVLIKERTSWADVLIKFGLRKTVAKYLVVPGVERP